MVTTNNKYVFDDYKNKIDAVEYIEDHAPVDPGINFDDIFPEGATYTTTSGDLPQDMFGGTWVKEATYNTSGYNYWHKHSGAYAFYNIPYKSLVFFRDYQGKYENEQHVYLGDIYGSGSHGIVFTDFENETLAYPPWYDYELDDGVLIRELVTDVYFDNQYQGYAFIQPVSTAKWFSGMTNLGHVSLGYNDEYVNLGLDTSRTIYMDEMFADCGISHLDLTGSILFDTSKVESANRMFAWTGAGSSPLEYIYVKEDWDVSQLTDGTGSDMFLNCTNLPNYTSSDVSYRKAISTDEGGYLTVGSQSENPGDVVVI